VDVVIALHIFFYSHRASLSIIIAYQAGVHSMIGTVDLNNLPDP
jgi:hypothetical protein